MYIFFPSFSGINIVPGGITFQRDEDGRETGGAFVELCSETDVEKALTRDRKEIQHRYVLHYLCGHRAPAGTSLGKGDMLFVCIPWCSK